jgi:hypothetical protein
MAHFKIKLNGIGLHCGRDVMVDRLDKLHGDVFNHAYKIGEDLCSDRAIFISSAVKNRIEKNPIFSESIFSEV